MDKYKSDLELSVILNQPVSKIICISNTDHVRHDRMEYIIEEMP